MSPGTPASGTAAPAAAAARHVDWSPTAVYALAFLTLISVFNYLDRSILGLALPLIKSEMQVSDTALGLVSGLAFVLCYSLLGIPLAWLADRYSRRNIIAAGFAFWSLMTIVTGVVHGIWQLAVTRFLMGAGEACGIAPSNSMISDLFRRARRPLAMALFGLANAIAFIALFPVAGWIAEHHGWRAMYLAAGLPGLLLALLFRATVREPARGAMEERPPLPARPAFWVSLRELLRSRTYVYLLVGATFMGANAFAAGAWTPTFLQRVHGMGLATIASTVGPVRGVLGGVGVLAGGLLIDRLSNRHAIWRVRLPAISCVLVGPAELMFLLGEQRGTWLTGFALASLLTLMHQAPVFAAAVNVARIGVRALAIALLLTAAGLLGQVAGPAIVGMLNDHLAAEFGAVAIRYSLLIVAVTPIIGGIALWRAAAHYVADSDRAVAAAEQIGTPAPADEAAGA
jgi:MFS family permease